MQDETLSKSKSLTASGFNYRQKSMPSLVPANPVKSAAENNYGDQSEFSTSIIQVKECSREEENEQQTKKQSRLRNIINEQIIKAKQTLPPSLIPDQRNSVYFDMRSRSNFSLIDKQSKNSQNYS